MSSIIRADNNDVELLAGIGRQTFIESHGHCASVADIQEYVNEKYSSHTFREELANSNNIYHKVFYNGQLAGYSKIMLNSSTANINSPAVTKLERLYLLKQFYGLQLASALLDYNIKLARQYDQQGMWLYVWKDNHRAIHFYLKNGFKIIGSHDFKISETHSNPNHQMLLWWGK